MGIRYARIPEQDQGSTQVPISKSLTSDYIPFGAHQQCKECEDFIEKLAKDRVDLTFLSKGISSTAPRACDRTYRYRYHMPRPTRRAEIGYKTRPRGYRCIRILLTRFKHALHALYSFVVVLVLVVLVMQLGFRYFGWDRMFPAETPSFAVTSLSTHTPTPASICQVTP